MANVLFINGQSERVYSYKYLGILICPDQHKQLCSKAQQQINYWHAQSQILQIL